ncbi:MAG: ROK family protein [Candidatus Limnocylindrales bacterium]
MAQTLADNLTDSRPSPSHARKLFPDSVLALDLGGTQLRTAVVFGDGRVIARRASQTPRADAEALVAACAEQLYQTLVDAAQETAAAREAFAQPVALAISAPGPLDPFRGVLIDPPNLDRTLWGFPLASRLGERVELPAVMERDTQIAALAEGDFGAARGLTDYVYLTISTGIGGGVVSGGRLLRGTDGLANELGHITIDINGPLCGCGARGHLEGITSGTGIALAAHEAGLTSASGELGAREVAQAEVAGNSTAARIMDRARAAFAAAAVSIVDIYNPQRIVVGGGLAIGQGDRLLEPAREAIKRYAFKRQAESVDVVPAQLGDDVGLVGGLSLVALARLGDHVASGQSDPGLLGAE